jgi:hypothetical protein
MLPMLLMPLMLILLMLLLTPPRPMTPGSEPDRQRYLWFSRRLVWYCGNHAPGDTDRLIRSLHQPSQS